MKDDPSFEAARCSQVDHLASPAPLGTRLSDVGKASVGLVIVVAFEGEDQVGTIVILCHQPETQFSNDILSTTPYNYY